MINELNRLNQTLNLVEEINNNVHNICDKIETCVDKQNQEFAEAYLIKLRDMLLKRNKHIDEATKMYDDILNNYKS